MLFGDQTLFWGDGGFARLGSYKTTLSVNENTEILKRGGKTIVRETLHWGM